MKGLTTSNGVEWAALQYRLRRWWLRVINISHHNLDRTETTAHEMRCS